MKFIDLNVVDQFWDRKSRLVATTLDATVRLSGDGGVVMQKALFAGLFLFGFFAVAGGGAQNPGETEQPVWTMEFLKVMPGQFGPTLGYLDDNWMHIREEAKRKGAVLSYHRIAEQSVSGGDPNIVLLTEYKNQAAYDAREELFVSILRERPTRPSGVIEPSGIIRPYQRKDLYETVSTRVFKDYQAAHSAQFRLLAKD